MLDLHWFMVAVDTAVTIVLLGIVMTVIDHPIEMNGNSAHSPST